MTPLPGEIVWQVQQCRRQHYWTSIFEQLLQEVPLADPDCPTFWLGYMRARGNQAGKWIRPSSVSSTPTLYWGRRAPAYPLYQCVTGSHTHRFNLGNNETHFPDYRNATTYQSSFPIARATFALPDIRKWGGETRYWALHDYYHKTEVPRCAHCSGKLTYDWLSNWSYEEAVKYFSTFPRQ